MGLPGSTLGVPPCGRAYFFLLRQEKVAKKKATPRSAPGVARSLALLGRPGGWLNSPSAQTTPADSPRPTCVAQRLPRGPEERPRSTIAPKNTGFHAPPKKPPKNEIHRFSMDASPGPLERCRATQGLADRGRGLFEGEARVPQPPPAPSSTGNRRSRHRPRVAFFLLTFSWRSKKKQDAP